MSSMGGGNLGGKNPTGSHHSPRNFGNTEFLNDPHTKVLQAAVVVEATTELASAFLNTVCEAVEEYINAFLWLFLGKAQVTTLTTGERARRAWAEET